MASLVGVLVLGFFIGRWSTRAGDLTEVAVESGLPTVREKGVEVIFPQGSPSLGLLKASAVLKSDASLSMTAPSRIVVSKTKPTQKEDSANLLFENPETAALFSQFRQSRSNFQKAQQNLSRIKDLFQNQGATGKDLNEAQNELDLSRASFNENDGKLRTIGIDPSKVDAMKAGTVWVISEIPESQIREVELGEAVKIFFSFSPNAPRLGRANAIGEGVDPLSRTIKVLVELENSDGELRPGMFAKADFGAMKSAALVIPAGALVRSEDHDFVFVEKAPGHFLRKEVVVLPADGELFLVSSGLNAEDSVVTSGAMLLKGLSFQF